MILAHGFIEFSPLWLAGHSEPAVRKHTMAVWVGGVEKVHLMEDRKQKERTRPDATFKT